VNVYTIYISKSNCNQMCIIHKWKINIYVGKSVFVRVGESKKKANARVLEDVTSFLSNSTGSSNSSQQWGLKSPEETLVKIEITGYNEG
jgi:ribosomal protein L5